ncbi:ArgE/DapE family deacylase [Exiguobacterium sp.]|uniref:M20 family metallopeptidase n=1 Tax=Exiguobacterium sp. TaxID=44751 RepID=UPI0028ADEBB6|nr:ArgE/DapE family deacylase [Exiguobacterium sp.]
MQTAIAYLQQCLQIPSVNPMDGEEAVARYVYDVLFDHQISTEWIEISPKRICLVATVPASEDVSRPAVLGLSGHLDTVPVQGDGWTKDPYGGEIEDGRIYGRGASDMKSGVMAMVQALIQYRERQERPNTIKLLITSDEENGMTGARHLTEQGHADDLDALLITEPTSGMIGYAQKGVVGIEVTCRGKSAHSSAPQLGRNAIDDVYRVIQEVKSERFSITANHHPALGPVVASITSIKGGEGPNVVPSQASFYMDIRTIPGFDRADVLAAFTAIERRLVAEDSEFDMNVTVIKDIPSCETDEQAPFLQQVADTMEQVSGVTPRKIAIPGGTDGAMFSQAKKSFPIAIASFHDFRLAHQVDESIPLSEYEKTIAFCFNLINTPLHQSLPSHKKKKERHSIL